MIFPQFVIYVLIYDYLKFRKDLSITSEEIANYISVALAVALSVVIINYNAEVKYRHRQNSFNLNAQQCPYLKMPCSITEYFLGKHMQDTFLPTISRVSAKTQISLRICAV